MVFLHRPCSADWPSATRSPASGRAGRRQADPHSSRVPWRAGSFPVVGVCEGPWVSCQSTAPFCSALRSCVPVLATSDPEDTCGLKATSRSLSPLVECNLLNLAPHSRPWILGGCVPCVFAAPALATGRDGRASGSRPQRPSVLASARSAGGGEKHWEWPENLEEEQRGLGWPPEHIPADAVCRRGGC